MDEQQGDSEEGRIALLMTGLMMVVLAFVLVGASITILHVQDRRLLACADRVAAAASNVVDAEAFYGVDGKGQRLVPSPSGSWAVANAALSRLGSTTCRVGTGVHLLDVTVADQEVLVTLSAVANVPLVPPLLGSLVAPTLNAASSARTS